MQPQELAEQKKFARAEALRRMAAIPAECWQHWGGAMARSLFLLPAWAQADTVFCFASTALEPDTLPILRRAWAEGKTLCLPRTLGGGRMETVPLRAAPDAPGALAPGRWGILEPPAGAPAIVPGPGALAVIPCLGAAPGGVRLGRGGGYYDRFLARYPGQSVLLCPKALLFPSLPAGALDARVPNLLTEDGLAAPWVY